jgi:hypothetical protein
MAETFNNQSPYLYAYNNPVRFTDYMGMNAEDEVKDEDPPKKEEPKKEEEKKETEDSKKDDPPKKDSETSTEEENQTQATSGTITISMLLGELLKDASITAIRAVPIVFLLTLQGDTPDYKRDAFAKPGGVKDVWPGEFGAKPNPNDVDWGKGDAELAKEVAKGTGATKAALNKAKKWFRNTRPGGKGSSGGNKTGKKK